MSDIHLRRTQGGYTQKTLH